MNGVLKTYRSSLAALAALALFSMPGTMAEALEIGDTVSGTVDIAGSPCPCRRASIPSSRSASRPSRSRVRRQVVPEDYGPVRRVVLARVDDGVVSRLIEVVANTLAHPDGWGMSADCRRTDIYATLTRYKSGWDVSCLWVKPLQPGVEETPPESEAVQAYAGGASATLPTFWIEAGFRVSNRQDLVDVRYRFAPLSVARSCRRPIPRLGTPARSPERLSRSRRCRRSRSGPAWSTRPWRRADLRSGTRSGFRRPLESWRRPRPIANGVSRSAELRTSGVIDDAEFERQQAILNAEVEPEAENAWTYATVAGYKAFTYRVVVTAINAGIDYVFIGQPFAAGVLVVLQVVVNTTKFFFHEVMWQELFGVGPLQRDTPRVMDFVVASAAPKS